VTAFGDLGSSERLAIWGGVTGRAVEGERTTLVVVELEAGKIVPEHSHDNEQLGVCAAGSLTFRIGDETRDLGPGDTWRIDSDVPHEVHVGPEGAIVIETFTPARSDWSRLERLEPTSPLWPT
jgi:quercetin dioxygenase-like cupin family protein